MKLRSIDRRLLTVLLIVFVNMLGSSLILPILPLYAQRQFQMSPQTIALLIASFFAAQFLAGPYLGKWSDRYGRIPILIISQVGTVISFVMLAYAPNTAWLFIARILDGITGGNIIVAQAYVTDVTPRERRTESLGYIFAVFGLGFMFGPALGGLLSAAYGIRLPFLLAALAALAVVIMTWRLLDETLTPEQRMEARKRRVSSLSPGAVLRNGPLLAILGIAFVGQFSLGMLQSTFALYGEAVLFQNYSEDATNIGIGLLLTVVGAAQFFTQTWLLRRLLRRYPETWLVILGSILRAVGGFIFAVITTPWLGPFGSLFFATGIGIMMPPLQSLATTTVDDQERGGVLGLYQSSINLSTIISTALGGYFFGINPTLPYSLGAVTSLLVVIPALGLVRWRKRTASTLDQPTG
ncbi:MAG: MFS transporter [Caldilineaceae bacterium]|nr:MFS transporter [Caldilineaceae bacterium]